MAKILKKETIIFCFLLVALILLSEIVLEEFHLATWPAFMVMVFFFMAHRNMKEAPAILIGSFFGLCNLLFIKAWYSLIIPMLGGDMTKYTAPETVEAMFYGKLIFVAVFVASIVFLKGVLPKIFNDYAFMFFIVAALASNGNTAASIAAKTVAGVAVTTAGAGSAAVKAATDQAIASTVPVTNVYQWMGIELIGGAIFILAIYGIGKLVPKLAGISEHAHLDI